MYIKGTILWVSVFIYIGITAWAYGGSLNRLVTEKLIVRVDYSSSLGESFKVSPDCKRVAYTTAVGNKWCVIIDRKAEKQYDTIGKGTITFSSDSTRVGYAAKEDNKWFIVVYGKEMEQYDGIMVEGVSIFSPDSKRLAYGAAEENKWFVAVDGIENKGYDNIGEGSLVFSPDSNHVGYEGYRS